MQPSQTPRQPQQVSDAPLTPEQPTAPPPPPPPPPEAYGPAPTYAMPSQKSSGLAIASMVLCIIGLMSAWFVVGGFFAVVGLVLGIVSLAKKNGWSRHGDCWYHH